MLSKFLSRMTVGSCVKRRSELIGSTTKRYLIVDQKIVGRFAPTIPLSDGQSMPTIGLGTYPLKGVEAESTVKKAIDVGYRLFDTAYFYQNEAAVGKAIRDKIQEGVIDREDVFIVTKLWAIHNDPYLVDIACCMQNSLLGLDYIDLYLLHFPVGLSYVKDDLLFPVNADGCSKLADFDYLETYKAMEKLMKVSLVKSIGVSNFNIKQLQRILDNASVKPVAHQFECNPGILQPEMIKFCNEHGIAAMAATPLARPNPKTKEPGFYFSPELHKLAKKYKKTPGQIILRFLIQFGTIPVPKTSKANHLKENFDVFDFKLSSQEMEMIEGFNTGDRHHLHEWAKGHQNYPFDD